MSKAITANRLTDGRVVYWTAGQDWAEDIADAAVFADDDSAVAALAVAQGQTLAIVGAYPIDVVEQGPDDGVADGQIVTPSGRKVVRETIRVHGPTAGSLHLTTSVGRNGAVAELAAA